MLFLPYQADFTFWLDPKSKQKSQGCVRFTRKSYMTLAKITELVVPPQTAVIFLRQHHLFSGSSPEATLQCFGRDFFRTAFLNQDWNRNETLVRAGSSEESRKSPVRTYVL